MLNALYNQVDEEVHKLVILSNKSQKQLESLLEVRRFEEQTQQVTYCISLHILSSLLQIFTDLNKKIRKQIPEKLLSTLRSNSGSVLKERSSSCLWNHSLCQ